MTSQVMAPRTRVSSQSHRAGQGGATPEIQEPDSIKSYGWSQGLHTQGTKAAGVGNSIEINTATSAFVP